MSGLDCLREEMARRGCTKAQIESKTAAVVLDILANSGDKYTKLAETEGELDRKIRGLELMKSRLEREIQRKRWDLERIQEGVQSDKEYIEAFNRSLTMCETEEGRDAMRRAQMFVNSVDVETKYDNTAFIVALGAILSDGKIGAIEELRKINPRMPGGRA